MKLTEFRNENYRAYSWNRGQVKVDDIAAIARAKGPCKWRSRNTKAHTCQL